MANADKVNTTVADLVADLTALLKKQLDPGAEDSAVSAIKVLNTDEVSDEDFYAAVEGVRAFLRKSKRTSTPQNIAQVAHAISQRLARQAATATATATT